jgi:acyl dehydratase
MFDFSVGETATLVRRFSRADLAELAALVDGQFGDDRIPGALIGSLFSRLLGTRLPGRGTNWMRQRLRFYADARVGEALTASVEIVRVRPEKQLVDLRCTCHSPSGLVCDGEALVLAREMDLRG